MRAVPPGPLALLALLLLACWLFSFDTTSARNSLPSPSRDVFGNGSYQSDHPSLVYQGSWTADASVPQASGGEVHHSSVLDSSVSFEFEGTAITWWTATGPAEGVALVTIDGFFMPYQDLYSAGPMQWQVPVRYQLPAGPHQITVEVTNRRNANSTGYNVTVDAFTVEGAPFGGVATPTPLPTATPTPQLWLEAQVDWQRPVGSAASAYQAPLTLWVHPAGQGNPAHDETLFTATLNTDQDGRAPFGLDGVDAGSYDLYVKGSHTLGRLVENATLGPGTNGVAFGVLPEGDTDGDESVGDQDFLFLADRFGLRSGEAGFDSLADLDGNGVVDISDVSLLAGNYGLQGPLTDELTAVDASPPVALQVAPAAQALLSTLSNRSLAVNPALPASLSFSSPSATVGSSLEVDLLADNVTGLYGVELSISFDSGRLSATGIFPGPLLPGADVAISSIDNGSGQVRYVATLLGDVAAAGSSGVIATIAFDAISDGPAQLSWTRVKLSDRDSQALAATTQNGSVTLSIPTSTPLPTATPTRTPRPTATPEPPLPPAPEPVATELPSAAPPPAPAAPPEATPTSGPAPLVPGPASPHSPVPIMLMEEEMACPVPLGLALGPLTGVSIPATLPAGVPPLSSEGQCSLLDPFPGTGLVRTTAGGSSVEFRVDNQGGAMAVRFETLPGLPPDVILPTDATVARVFSLELFRYQPADHSASKIIYGAESGSAPIVARWKLNREDYSRTADGYGDMHPERLVFAWITRDGHVMKAPTSWCPHPAPYGTLSAVLADRPPSVGISVFLLMVLPEEREGQTMPADPQYFPQTGYRIGNPAFWDYFNRRGGVRSFGYPVSRQFTLLGYPVQLFQRGLMQQLPSGSVSTMNLLDEGIMPYNRMNGSVFPLPDQELIGSSPVPGNGEYAEQAIQFLMANVPDEWEGMPVGFLRAYLSTVRYEDAFPEGGAPESLVPLLNLELWGLPTSRPAHDPTNHNFVYQRFQRGILHYDAATGATQGLLLGDYLRMVMTGQGIPADLESQAADSRFYRQYTRSNTGHLGRPDQLPGTNLVGAFEADIPQEMVASAVSATALLLLFGCVGMSIVGPKIQRRKGKQG